jgi:hypothetical protein
MEPTPDDPLRRHLSGKRRWIRMPAEHPVELRSRKVAFAGLVLDLSRGGLRVVVEDPAFYEGSDDGLALVLRRFPRGATIRFVDEGIARRIRIVRIMPHKERCLSMGCAFEKALTEGEAVRLGVDSESSDARCAPCLIEIACED